MLRREPTRIDLKPDDKEEYESLKREKEGKAKAAKSDIPEELVCRLSSNQALQFAWGFKIIDMEVEIKLRLANEAAHEQLAKALQHHFREKHHQENYFFDGAQRELSSQRVVLRCRFYNTDKRALLTIKGQQILKDGIGRGSEVEDDIDPTYARSCIDSPQKLLSLKLDILQSVLRKYDVQQLTCLGGFKNERCDYDWEGFKLELDKTMFPWGTVYEVEVETEDPETLKVKLEAFLKENGVQYKYSTTTKFANFMNHTLL